MANVGCSHTDILALPVYLYSLFLGSLRRTSASVLSYQSAGNCGLHMHGVSEYCIGLGNLIQVCLGAGPHRMINEGQPFVSGWRFVLDTCGDTSMPWIAGVDHLV